MKKQCQICGKDESKVEIFSATIVRPAISEIIKETFSTWNKNGFICADDLRMYRNKSLIKLMEDEKGELTRLEKDVIDKLTDYETISINIYKEFEGELTFGQKVSDKIASFGGSWRFIFLFAFVLFVWISINSYALLSRPFDPFPFILLNLILSCIAAIQAPVIMMSQNRQEARDRKRSEADYKINLKSELELRQLHQKVDHLLSQQWERMVEIQELQLEVLEELRKNSKK
jgi:uncharacterized membrane protein